MSFHEMTTQSFAKRFFRCRLRKEVVLFCADLVACTGCIGLALALRFSGSPPVEHALPYAIGFPALVGWWTLMAYSFGLYDFKRRLSLADHFFGGAGAALFGVAGGYFALAMLRLYYLPDAYLSRGVALLDFLLLAAWFASSRACVLLFLRWVGYKIRLLLVGPLATCQDLADEIRKHAPKAVEVAGIAAIETDVAEHNAVARITEAHTVIARERVDQVVLAGTKLSQEDIGNLLSRYDSGTTEIYLYPDLDLSILANVRVISIAGLPLVPLWPALGSALYGMAKRVMDVVVSGTLLVLSLPLWLVVAIAVKLDSPGSVLFAQERVGLRGRLFCVFKFRTMAVGAEAETGPVLSSADDPRVTRVGRVLRRLRIDEIPQLWNVLIGRMSLVGPRPERPEFVEQFIREIPLYERRLLVRPGLTGLAQIHGRYDTDYRQKLRYDLIYLNSMSLGTDLRILVATIRTVLTGRGSV